MGASLIALTPAVPDDVASGLPRSAVNVEYRGVKLTDTLVSPIETWIETLSAAAGNVQTLVDEWGQTPFVVAQQVAANWVQFASDYVGAYQQSAQSAVNYFTGNSASDFWPLMEQALNDITAGNIQQAFAYQGPLYTGLLFEPSVTILAPLENIPAILAYSATDFANGLTYMFGDGVFGGLAVMGEAVELGLGAAALSSIGDSLQPVYNSLAAGDPLGVVLNVLNIPGVATNDVLNGFLNSSGERVGGLLATGGPIKALISTVLPIIARDMVAPDAQSIAEGGSLPTAIQEFINQLINGWPSLTNLSDIYFGGVNMAPSAVAMSADFPGLSADVLKAFDPAMVTDIAGSLGPSLGANIAGSLATTLSVDLSTLALHIISAL
ncbi:hypothetical protein BMG05_10585 [Mycobacterium malmoense]|nr:hypothetical protein BMG05_10585 [Mycobacterium malmoense]